ncbi:MAG: hypothetical protein IK011_03310 [Bacteroidaceae bacterium]|nr:hypothetical protein [Bacteroidaceae bacterium]MBR5034538.1 hypothetical protein [Bacteroidales bacterium]
MKKLIIASAVLFLSITSFAQSDNETTALLEKAIAQFEKGGVELKGVVHYGDGAFALTLKMDHERFNAKVADFALWFDNKTQWFLRSGEIYISEPSDQEQMAMNPYLLMKNAKEYFNIRSIEGKQLPKGAVAGLLVTSRNYSELENAKFYFDKDSRPISLQATLQGGQYAEVEFTSFKNGLKYEDSEFVCNTKDYDAEIIDMR